jgi:hypothetical protein
MNFDSAGGGPFRTCRLTDGSTADRPERTSAVRIATASVSRSGRLPPARMSHNTGACRNADQDRANTAQEHQGSLQGPNRRRGSEFLTNAPPVVRPQGQRPVDVGTSSRDTQRLPAVSVYEDRAYYKCLDTGTFCECWTWTPCRFDPQREDMRKKYFAEWRRRLKARDWV